MWRTLVYQFYILVCLLTLYIVSANEQICDPHSLPKCGEHERCLQTKVTEPATCQCERGYERNNNGVCTLLPTEVTTTVRPVIDHPKSGGASVAAGLLIPTFLILFAAGAYYGARRYKWVQRFRQFRQNRYGNVLVTRDETDDDDPPIA